MSSFQEYQYDSKTLDFLTFVAGHSGPIPCRDQLIVDLLHRYDIPAYYSGDLVLFDTNYVHTSFSGLKDVRSVVFTVQHHEKYKEQSFSVLRMIRDVFPNAKYYVALHSNVGIFSHVIAEFAVGLGFEELHLYGESDNLWVYDTIDLHVGYRLHGHISFLRRRKPSVLLVEDARAFGFSRTMGTRTGCFDALDEDVKLPSQSVCREVERFLGGQLNVSFESYNSTFNFIDKTFDEVINPFFNKFTLAVQSDSQ